MLKRFDEEKKGTKHLITALTDIYKLSDQLISTVKFLSEIKEAPNPAGEARPAENRTWN